MNNKFSDINNNKNSLIEEKEQLSSSSRMNFSIKEILSASKNTYKARLIRSFLFTLIGCGLSYGGVVLFKNFGVAKDTAMIFLKPLAGITGIMGTKTLNEAFAYFVAKIKGHDLDKEDSIDLNNPEADFVNKVKNEFENSDSFTIGMKSRRL